MITKEKISRGMEQGVIRLVADPNMGSGTVCSIGDNWFYFGGLTAEELSPEEYLKEVPKQDIVDEIFTVLEDFKKYEAEFGDEYRYYDAVLAEAGL